MVTKQDLKRRAEFFSKYLFGIKYIGEIGFMPKTVEDDYTYKRMNNPMFGLFEHNEDAWDTDLDTEDYGIYVEDDYDEEYSDYIDTRTCLENCNIWIISSAKKDVLWLNDILLHELIHFALWYKGLEYKDGQKQFEDTLKKYKVSSNYGNKFDYETNKWKAIINRKQMQIYEDMYQDYIKKGN